MQVTVPAAVNDDLQDSLTCKSWTSSVTLRREYQGLQFLLDDFPADWNPKVQRTVVVCSMDRLG